MYCYKFWGAHRGPGDPFRGQSVRKHIVADVGFGGCAGSEGGGEVNLRGVPDEEFVFRALLLGENLTVRRKYMETRMK